MDQATKRIAAHFTGQTRFVDDIDKPSNTLYGYIVKSDVAYGGVESVNYEKALKSPGVCAILSHKDIPGKNSMGAVFDDEPILAEDYVEFIGQAVLLIAATSRQAAADAAKKVEIVVTELEPVLDVEESFRKRNFPFDPLFIESGDVESGFENSNFVIEGELAIGGQEHFYLETNAAMSIPKADGTIVVYSSTQNPSENQMIISHALDLESSRIEVIML